MALLLAGPIPLLSQQPVEISLEEVLQRVQGSNTEIGLSGKQAELAAYELQSSNAVFLPTLSVSHTAMNTTNPLMAFGFKLNQEILTPADFDPGMLNEPEAISSFVTDLSLEQPLINLDGFQMRKAGKITAEAMELQLYRTRERLDYEAEMAYGRLQLAHKSVEVLKKARAAAHENLVQAQDRYDRGLLNKAELLEAKVRLSTLENQLDTAISQVGNASDQLGFLMGAPMGPVYRPTEELRAWQSAGEVEGNLELRADIRAMELQKEAQWALVKAERMGFMPRLNAFANYQLHDDKIFQGRGKGYLIGASLSWDIFKGAQRFANLGKSRTNYEKAKLEQQQYLANSTMELQRVNRLVKDAQQKQESSKLAMEQSGEALRIRTDRFREGLERTTDLLMAEALHAQSQLEHYRAILQYNQAQALLKFLTASMIEP